MIRPRTPQDWAHMSWRVKRDLRGRFAADRMPEDEVARTFREAVAIHAALPKDPDAVGRARLLVAHYEATGHGRPGRRVA